MSDFLAEIRDRVLIFDGAFGTWMQGHDLTADDFGGPALEGCNENLVLTRPDLVAQMHSEFFEAGVDAVETATFGAFPLVLNEYGIADATFEINERAARIAKEVAQGFAADGRPRFVIGSMGPGTRLPSLGQIPFTTLRSDYEAQVDGLLAGGVDVLLIETVYDLLQAKAAINGARRAMRTAGREVPLMVQVTMETTGRMLVGTEIGAALTALEAMQPDVIGVNCATGPEEMTEHLRYLAQHARTFLSCLPNAGLPSVVDGHTHYDLTPDSLADAHERFINEFGLNIVGGCCGTTPAHLRAVAERIGTRAPIPRTPDFEPGCSSIYSHVPFRQELAYLAIGERTNANGSRAFRDSMLAADWDTCVRLAREQVREGAHVLDVCVDYVGRDGTVDMEEIASRFATQASLPLVFDSTEPQVVEAGLQHHGGKAILNSANLEEGDGEGKRMDRVFSLAREYGAAVICLTIDEEGQARDADWKVRVAHRLHDIATQRYGLDATDLIFDPLTFPLSTGDEDLRRDAMETIEAIRRIKAELPGVSTVLGLSNVSFGLKPAARHVLNSVFLHECTQAGLDAAIVHAARIMPLHRIPEDQREVALDLIYDRNRSQGHDPLQAFMALFEGVEANAVEREDLGSLPTEERLKRRIIDGNRDGLIADLDEQLESMPALAIVNDVLLDGMKVVGDLFGRGEMQLPFVLQSAETMKAAVGHLEPHMEKADGSGKGTVVLATVKGDVHDIGKNLVDIILTNNGYTVHNLGIKVPITTMVEKATEVGADAIGMSGLLVKSTIIMRENLEELNARGLADGTPVLLGGAALTRTYVEADLRKVYDGRVFYGKDAFEGLHTMDTLMSMKRAGEWDPDFGRTVGAGRISTRERTDAEAANVEVPARSDVAADATVFTPPFVGSRVAKGVPLDDIVHYVNETALFRNQWQFRPDKSLGESDDDFRVRVRGFLRDQLERAKEEQLLVPAVAWGYHPVNSLGDELVVWKDDDRRSEWLRFRFPRQHKDRFLCVADFFRPVDSGEADYAAFHVVTMGSKVSERERELFAADQYQDYLFLHGLGVEMAEALAELWHRRIREEWGFAAEDGPTVAGLFRQQYRGSRYSWGYPACPDLEEQTKVAELLDIERIGVNLTEEFHLVPEQSTSAIIVSHPEAKYFVV